MAQSYVDYSGDGVTTGFAIPFPYLSKAHVHVYVGGTAGVPGAEVTAWTWLTSSTIQITTPPVSGVLNIEIRRYTSRTIPVTTFTDGSVEFSSDFNAAFLQTFYLAQEFYEQTAVMIPQGHSIQSHTDVQLGDTEGKGYLMAFDVSSKLRTVAVGTDGKTLEADSTATAGISWQQGLRKLVTAAGDLLIGTASGVMARLGIGAKGAILATDGTTGQWQAVGANGSVLSAQSGQANGLLWQTLASLFTNMTVSGTITGPATLATNVTVPKTILTGNTISNGTYPLATKLTGTHQLGSQPLFINSYIQCTSADAGYAVGDRVYAPLHFDNAGAAGWVVFASSTNISVVTASNAPIILNGTTPTVGVAITVSKWQLVVTPYLLQ